MSILNADVYKLIARTLGRTLAYIQQEQGVPHEPMAFRVTVDALIREFEHDNPRFDARRFRRIIEAAKLSEYDTDATSGPDVRKEAHDAAKIDPAV